MEPGAITNAVVFRPAKRRKFKRIRLVDEDEEATSDESAGDVMTSTDPDARGGPVQGDSSVAETLKLRRIKPRRHGIEFSGTRPNPSNEGAGDLALTVAQHQDNRLKAISDRFVSHSGQMIDVDKHMFVSPGFQSTNSR